jgi:hypothetical protein
MRGRQTSVDPVIARGAVARRRRFMGLTGLLLLCAGAQGVFASGASAMSGTMTHRRVIPYPLEFVWPTTIRYLRVDRGYSIVDRDEESGYLLFEFPHGRDGKGTGSVEAFATEDDAGRPSVNLHVSTTDGPSYLPNTIADGIAKKLREERGQPARPPAPEQPTPPPPETDDPP